MPSKISFTGESRAKIPECFGKINWKAHIILYLCFWIDDGSVLRVLLKIALNK